MQLRETEDTVDIAKESLWPVGPTPEPLKLTTSGYRNSDSSEESDSSLSMTGSSPASSVSSPYPAGKGPFGLQGVDEITVDQRHLTKRILSRLRDLYELSNGHVCLSDFWPVAGEALDIDDFAKGLGLKLDELDIKDGEEEEVVVKKVKPDNDRKRLNIVKEILETEVTYINGLQELVDVTTPSSSPLLS